MRPADELARRGSPPIGLAPSTRSWIGERRFVAEFTVAAAALAAAAAWIVLGRRVAAPWIMGDELEYSEMAKSFAGRGEFLIREGPASLRTLYPAVIAPAWLFDSMHTTYAAAKAINLVLMTSAVVPLYLWARRLLPGLYPVLVAILFLLLPSFAYTGELVTESAFLPAFILTLYWTALALERPTRLRQGLALLGIAVATSIRLQGLVLVLVVPAAILLKAALDVYLAPEPQNRLRALTGELWRYWISLGAVLLAAASYVAFQVARGNGLASGLATYQAVTNADYSLREVARWTVFHLGELAFSVAIVPMSALVLLVGLALGREHVVSAAERAYLALAVAALTLIVTQVGAFASEFSHRIEERNMFCLAPVLLVALALWLSRGLPRPPALTALAVTLPAVLILTVPLESLFNIAIVNDTFGLIPLYRLSLRVAGGAAEVRVLLGLGALAAGFLFAAAPRRFTAVAMPLAVALFLALSSRSVLASIKEQSQAARIAPGVATDLSWVDRSLPAGAGSSLIYTTDFNQDPHPVWQTEFWNRSVGPLYNFEGGRDPTGLPSVPTRLDPITGRIVPDGVAPREVPPYAIAPPSLPLAGRVIATHGRFVLYRIDPPLRIRTSTHGIYPDGWTGEKAVYTQYSPLPPESRRIELRVSRAAWAGPDVPGRVRVLVTRLVRTPAGTVTELPLASRSWVIHSLAARLFGFPVAKTPFRVEITVEPTFSPAQFGLADTRQLGAQVAISFPGK